MAINSSDNFIIGRGSDTFKYPYSDLVTSLNNDLSFVSAPGDGLLTIQDSDGNTLGSFSANQATGSNTVVTIPEASVNLDGVVKLDDGGSKQTIVGGGGLELSGQLTLPGGGGSTQALQRLEIEALISSSSNQNLGYSPNGNNAGTVTITDGTNAVIPIVTNSVAGLMTGTQKQQLDNLNSSAITSVNLSYSSNGNSSGTVTNSAGTNATIPIVSDSTAGLMTGTQKQNLDTLVNAGSTTITGTLPISVSGGSDVRLNYNKGLILNGSNLEVDIGDGLIYDGRQIEARLGARLRFDSNGAIESEAPPDSVSIFPPIIVVNPNSHDQITARNPYQTPDIWTGNFQIPDGCTRFSVITRTRVGISSLYTGDLASTPNFVAVWVDGPATQIEFSGNGFSVVEDQAVKVGLLALNTTPVDTRGNGGILVRMNEITVTGSGNRTVSYKGYGSWNDAQGTGQGSVNWSALNMFILPME